MLVLKQLNYWIMKAIYTLIILLIPFIGFSQNGINIQVAASDSDGNKIVNQNNGWSSGTGYSFNIVRLK